MKCGDTVKCGDAFVTCSRPKDHPLVGFNNGKTRHYEFHRGAGQNGICAHREVGPA